MRVLCMAAYRSAVGNPGSGRRDAPAGQGAGTALVQRGRTGLCDRAVPGGEDGVRPGQRDEREKYRD